MSGIPIIHRSPPAEPRYEIINDSFSGHDCCFAYTVIDRLQMDDSCITFYPVAECSKFADAELICNALNARDHAH